MSPASNIQSSRLARALRTSFPPSPVVVTCACAGVEGRAAHSPGHNRARYRPHCAPCITESQGLRNPRHFLSHARDGGGNRCGRQHQAIGSRRNGPDVRDGGGGGEAAAHGCWRRRSRRWRRSRRDDRRRATPPSSRRTTPGCPARQGEGCHGVEGAFPGCSP